MTRFAMPHSLLCLFGIILMGCGGSDWDGPPLYPTTATITADGEPLTKVAVTLMPTAENPDLPQASGTTTDKGEVYFMTRSEEGVAAGTYKVVLSWTPSSEEYAQSMRTGVQPKSPLPPEWEDQKKTPETITIPEGGPDDDVTIEFQRGGSGSGS